jgi:hypothetical protein
MATDEELLAIKDRAAERLMALPGVTGVGLGGRVRSGRRINELVLKVYVTKKLPAEELDPAGLVPAEFEGIPTDVAEQPATGSLLQGPPAGKPEPPPSTHGDARRQRPLKGGSRAQVDLSGAGFGTLGCMLTAAGDASKVYALTNWHVLVADESTPTAGTTKAGQPTNDDSVTRCCSAIVGKVAGGGWQPDVGAVSLDPGMQWCADILEIGAVSGQRPITPTEAQNHVAVRKRGERSGLTGGTVESIGKTFTVGGRTYNDVMVVVPNADPSQGSIPLFFAVPGDSGSALVNEANEVVGLVFARPDPPAGGKYEGLVNGWAFPLEDVIQGLSAQAQLNVAVATATAPGVVQTVPGAPMMAVPREAATVLLDEPPGVSEPSPPGAPVASAPARRGRPVRVPIPALSAPPPPAEALARLQQGLDGSERGRALITLWLSHQRELSQLVNDNRRVATAWHRSGASALFQVLVRMLTEPSLRLPQTLNGQPLSACVERVCTVLERFASAALRDSLMSLRSTLPDFGGQSLEGIYSTLGAP